MKHLTDEDFDRAIDAIKNMKKITFKKWKIYYGEKNIGSYEQNFTDRFIPKFKPKWEWVYYIFDFHEKGNNTNEDGFKKNVVDSITKVFNCF